MQSGQIIILNGVPRSGKSSIAKVIQNTFAGMWLNLGVDAAIAQMTPEKLRPGIGLRPLPVGATIAERPEIEVALPELYAALHESIAVMSRDGTNVVVDIGYHNRYTIQFDPFAEAQEAFNGLPVLFVGVRCSLEAIMERRNNDPSGDYAKSLPGEPIPEPVLTWQEAVHEGKIYDLEVDTTSKSPEECADLIRTYLDQRIA